MADQVAVSERLFGARGAAMLAAWLDEQLARVDNLEFARQFSDHIDLPGVAPGDYAHRIVDCSGGSLVGGIRFYRRDLDRPFVEVIAHSFADLDALGDCVRSEWAMFRPRDVRLRVRPGRLRGPGVRTDVTVHAARYRDMAFPDAGVTLRPFDDLGDAIALVERRFAHMEEADPALHANVTPADPEELREWHSAGLLKAVIADGHVVGLLAIVAGSVDWIAGDQVYEEVIDAEFAGHHYAASAQTAWAHTIATESDTYLVGTIDGLNVASRKSAERAGRPQVLEDVFLPVQRDLQPLVS